jgi:uroporphyrinogen decarboxylase
MENYLIALIEDPKWILEMHEADVRLYLAAHEEMSGRGMRFDAARFSDDMGYRNGSLFSPQLYREIFQPGLKRLCDFFHERGLFTVLHSCGNVNNLIPDIIRTGFDSLNPLEVKAGMDLLKLKRSYGEKLSFMGGIDARKMSDDEAVIAEEIGRKVVEAKKGGGYIFHSDHSVPDTVSLEQFKRIIELVFEYGGYE